jgi:hypothetical protein
MKNGETEDQAAQVVQVIQAAQAYLVTQAYPVAQIKAQAAA